MKKRLSVLMVAIALVVGMTAGAEAGVTWLGSIVVQSAAVAGSPTKVAVDKVGRVYVTETLKNRLSIYDNKGILVKEITRLKGPIGVAVDSAGKIYIGNDSACNVEVYNPDYTLNRRIGGTSCDIVREFDTPNSIAVAISGDIYVVDTPNDIVKVYNADGSPKFTFGESGMGDGKFNYPLDIVLDETVNELYVVDLGIYLDADNIPSSGARVQAFDLSGQFKRSFGTYGMGEDPGDGIMTRPAGIAVDRMGRLNVTDSYQGRVHIFDKEGNFVGSIKEAAHPLNMPTGIAVGQDERMYIVSTAGTPPALEIYGLEDYTVLAVTPKEINLSGNAGGTAAGQDITISNSGPGAMQWWIQRAAGSQWITLSKESGQTGGTTSEAVTVGADLSSLAAGAYIGKMKVGTGGAEEEVTVNLQVQAQAVAKLEVTPVELTYTGQAGGSQPVSQTVTITLTGGTTWTARSNAAWLNIDPAAGSAGAAEPLAATVDTTGLAAGQYNSSITITADGATGSPAEVNVKLILSSAGQIEVTANIEEARWNITGEAAYQGGTKQWSQQDAPSGQYQISFEAVSGYMKPQDQTFTVQSGKTTAIEVKYKDLRALKKIVAGLGSGNRNPAEIKILNTDGTLAGADFIAFSYKYGVNVAAGDIDGDGIDEIIAGAGVNKANPARVKIFKADGSEIPGADFVAFTSRYGVNVAAGDLDGDGIAEIIVGSGIGSGNSANIRVFKSINAVITDTGINNIVETSRNGIYVAAGDIDGDGTDEIITGSGPDPRAMAVVRILKADTSAGVGSWSATQIKAITVNEAGKGAVVAAGDLNADGKAEILAGSSNTLNIKTYNAEGSAYGVEITEAKTDTGASIAAGDTDADGTAEIVLGAGASKGGPSEVRIYSAEGTFKNSFTGFSEPGGVNVCVGKVQ